MFYYLFTFFRNYKLYLKKENFFLEKKIFFTGDDFNNFIVRANIFVRHVIHLFYTIFFIELILTSRKFLYYARD